MIKDYRPYYIKKLDLLFRDWYAEHFLRPQFRHLGKNCTFMKPWHVRVFGAPTVPHLAARCANADDYAEGDPNVAEWAPWPAPPDGERIRVYRCADYPPEPGRMGRIFRCSTVMVNSFDPASDERDFSRVSPHHHDDFEQVSVQIDGDFTHHMRVTWTPDINSWREDEHRFTRSPATVVIPPPLIHTTQPHNGMRRFLIDVFAPPHPSLVPVPGPASRPLAMNLPEGYGEGADRSDGAHPRGPVAHLQFQVQHVASTAAV